MRGIDGLEVAVVGDRERAVPSTMFFVQTSGDDKVEMILLYEGGRETGAGNRR